MPPRDRVLGINILVPLVEQPKVVDVQDIPLLRDDGDGVFLRGLVEHLERIKLRGIELTALGPNAGGGGVETQAAGIHADDDAAVVLCEEGQAGKADRVGGELDGPVGHH